MILLISKFIRSFSSNEFKKVPNTCYALFYLPKSKDDVCDCIDRCKYDPPGNGFHYKLSVKTNDDIYLKI